MLNLHEMFTLGREEMKKLNPESQLLEQDR